MIGLMVLSPVSAFAADDYTISYFDDINDYYAGKIENEVPDGPYNEHFAPVKRKSR